MKCLGFKKSLINGLGWRRDICRWFVVRGVTDLGCSRVGNVLDFDHLLSFFSAH